MSETQIFTSKQLQLASSITRENKPLIAYTVDVYPHLTPIERKQQYLKDREVTNKIR